MGDSLLEIRRGDRFAFGRNWKAFAHLVDETRVATAVDSLCAALGIEDLTGRTFLDVGCGSGLFSLAAHRLGARVHSSTSIPRRWRRPCGCGRPSPPAPTG
ncbi:50S ribosomal protein L11 methyltransferase [Streptosporangium lutulentum]